MAKIKRITYVLKNTNQEVSGNCILDKTEKSIIPRKPYSKKAIKRNHQLNYEILINNKTPAEIRTINKYLRQIANGEWKYQINETQFKGFWPTDSCKVKYKRKFGGTG